MRKNVFYTLFILLATASMISSCVRDNFKYYGYEDQLEGYFPVDSIENGHTWTLTSECSSFVKGSVPGAAKLYILSGNPFTTTGVEILAETTTESRVSKQMTYMVPTAQSKVFAAVLDEDGNYLRLVQASTNQETINLDNTVPSGTPNTVTPQRIFYCFEADYPNPGDWDYNDVVMSITKEPTDNEEVVALKVRLDAVGYLSQIAAAVRLVGYGYDEVDITQDEASTFYREQDRQRLFIKQSDVKLKALNGDAVINLFDDAHLAMFHLASDGSVYRRYFNTIENPSSSNNGATQSPMTVTFYLNFHDAYLARSFTLAEVDPFILVQYGTAGENFWEVHTHPYKLTEILYNYYNGAAQSYNNGFSWALAIPYGKFRYPLEEQPIGMRKNSIVSGAYQESGHSFGEWMLDHAKAQDWYEYPAEGAVYAK
ncbi:MAG: LruC domain-containing protein [Prevotella sp.]|nr:LruC domain-containing protein [Prevotella sp.]